MGVPCLILVPSTLQAGELSTVAKGSVPHAANAARKSQPRHLQPAKTSALISRRQTGNLIVSKLWHCAKSVHVQGMNSSVGNICLGDLQLSKARWRVDASSPS